MNSINPRMNSSYKTRLLTMPALPVDVIIEILCRLPVKSLLRFRCLSKQFRSVIDSPDFINRHLQNHSLDPRLIVHGTPSRRLSDLFSVDFDSANNVLKLEHPFDSWGGDCTLIGSCNGLLALSHPRGISVGLWNISTKKHQILPKFWTDFDVRLNTYYFSDYVLDGFGYDVTSDDYKWVRVIHFDTKNFTEVTVYSLKTNSWRRIEDLPPYNSYFVNGMGVLVGGALNWVVRVRDVGDEDSNWRILSFDLKGEKLGRVSVPEKAVENKLYFDVVVFRGCLCLSCLYPLKEVLDIWVMKEYGVKESWTKLFSFTNSKPLNYYYRIRAFTYSKRGDKVLFYEGIGVVLCYDLEKETFESVETSEWPNFIIHVAIYVDSLVSPNVNIQLSGSGEKN